MQRPILDETHVHPAIVSKLGSEDPILAEVKAAVTAQDVVVVGMKQNPHPKRARQLLTEKGVPFQYLEYGSYFGEWRKRLVLKMWAGWPTFPMVFVKGTFIGGADELATLIESKELDTMLARPRA